MDLVSIGFLVIMVLAGGLVALIADRLGRTLGKKRLTLLGMRPRHTATTITVAAGMLIPFITVLTLAVVSNDVRDWIVQGRDALRQRDEARRQAQDLQSENGRITVLIGENKKELKSQTDKLASITVQFQTTSKELIKIRAEVVRLTAAITRSQNEIRRYQSELQSKRAQLANADKRLTALAQTLSTRSKELASLSTQYQSLKTSYDEVYRQREQANREYVKVTAENDQLSKLNATLRDDNQKASADLAQTRTDLSTAKTNLAEAQKALDVARANVTKFARFYAGNIESTRMSPQIFAAGDELARVPIPKGSSAQTAKGLFANLIRQSIATAKAHGAQGDTDGGNDFQAANLIARPDEKGIDTPPEKQEEKLIELMTDGKENLVLIATSNFNTFLGEWVPLEVRVYRNPTIYKQNEKIAEIAINGNESEAEVIQHISEFLTKTIKPKALKDHMIPVAGKEDAFGEISLSRIVSLAAEIRDKKRPIRLAAYAESDTRAADPLRLQLRVR